MYREQSALVPVYAQTSRVGSSRNFWRHEDPVFTDDGIVKGGMFPHQREWWEMDHFIKILVGGYGAGKTLILCKRIISLALQNAPCMVACVSPSYAIARLTTVATISALLDGKRTILGKRFKWTYNKSTHLFTISWKGRKATIVIASGDNPVSLKGPNLAAAGIDEPFIQDEEVFKQMVARVRHPNSIHSEICITGTPEELNWGYDLCVGEESDNHDVGFVQAATNLNKALDTEYVQRLSGAYADEEGKAYIEGEFVELAKGRVYHAFSRATNVTELKAPEGAVWGAGMDFNVNPMSFTIFWHTPDHIHITDEYELPNSDTEEACEVIKENHKQVGTVYPDPTGRARKTSAAGGQSDFSYITRAGFEIEAPSGIYPRRDRFNAANGMLKSRDGKVSCTVDPTCKKLIKYLGQHSYEKLKRQENMTHLLDAFSYPIIRLFPINRETVHVTKFQGA